MIARRRTITLPIPLLLGLAAFLLVLAYLVAAPFFSPAVPQFDPSPTVERTSTPSGAVLDTVTIDASDPGTWRFFDFARGMALTPPDTAGWDLALRRFNVIVAGAAADAGPVPFASLTRAPDGDYSMTAFGNDTTNPALARWYDYSWLSHVLTPKGHVYAVRTAGGRYAKLEFLSYYCTGPEPGCVTFRYVFQPSGAPEFD